MRPLVPVLVLVVLLLPAAAQQPEDLEREVDQLVGETVPPVQEGVAAATGDDLSQEDVRLYLNMSFTKGGVDLGGLLLGSGETEVQASIRFRAEMRVVSSDRVRAAAQREDAYNVSAENATALSDVYLTAEMFRATLSAEAIAAFQEEQGSALARYLEEAVPELETLKLDLRWSNTSPLQTPQDLSLTEPPLVLEIDAVVQYLRVESVPSLLSAYLERQAGPEDPKKAYVQRLKADHGDPLRARDFFAAAAYTQLLNLSMQPGWSLDAQLELPRGYDFTYFNENVQVGADGKARFRVEGDAEGPQDEAGLVVLASITHKRAVALALFATTMLAGLLVALPGRFLYHRHRLPRLAAQAAKDAGADAGGQPDASGETDAGAHGLASAHEAGGDQDVTGDART